MTDATWPDPTTVYYLCAADETVLYVGISNAFTNRLAQHSSDKPWWTEVAYAKFEHFPTRHHAAMRERTAIRQLQPKHNIRLNPHAGSTDCENCHNGYPRRKGLCDACYQYRYRTGTDRPA